MMRQLQIFKPKFLPMKKISMNRINHMSGKCILHQKKMIMIENLLQILVLKIITHRCDVRESSTASEQESFGKNQGLPSEILETTWSACCVVELMVHIGLELNIADLAQIGWFTSLSSSATLYKNSVCERKPALLFAFGNYSSMERHLVPYALL